MQRYFKRKIDKKSANILQININNLSLQRQKGNNLKS